MKRGVFVNMGGFHLFERSSKEMSNDHRCISRVDFHPLEEIDLLSYSKSFIILTSKNQGQESDWLAESLVLLQTSWFVMQCITRAIEHLFETHLKIMMLAYAAMNFVIYVFWWNKPLNANRPVRVSRISRESEPSETQPQSISEARKLTWETIRDGLKTILRFIAGDQDRDVCLNLEDRVPRFGVNISTGSDLAIADLIVLGIGVCFGTIHCIAQFFLSYSHRIVNLANIECRYDRCPIYIPLMRFLSIWLADIMLLVLLDIRFYCIS